MTKDADLKRVVRERMAATGEPYTSARAAVLATPPTTTERPEPTAPTETATGHPDAAGHPDGTGHPGDQGLAVPPDPFYDKTIRAFFRDSRLVSIPARRKARAVVLVELATRFEVGRDYDELQVNAVLGAAHEDFAYLRRELVDYHYLDRADGVYRRTTVAPPRSGNLLQELPVSEHARLGWS